MQPIYISNFVLIIGAMKGGTSSLYHFLAAHPEISPCTKKEPDFFASDTNFAKGMEWYRGLWDFDPNIHKIALEASTNYSKVPVLPNAAERIASADANFKFIYLLRNPIERIESHYTHSLFRGRRLHKETIPTEVHPGLINVSRYSMQIEEYYRRFPSDSILLLNFNDLKNNPHQLLTEVCDFLRISREFELPNEEHRNRSEGKIIDGPLWGFIEPIARVFPTQLLPKGSRNALRTILGQRVTKKVKLSEAQREFVLDELRDDLLKLKTKYNFDVSSWGISL